MRLVALLCSAVLPGCAEAPSAPRGNSPASNNTMGQAFHDAGAVAQASPGRTSAVGQGTSMAPLYSDNTLLVFNPIRYEELKPGMNIVYLNSDGRRVVHQLLASTPQGWTVVGLNNNRIDTDLVTPKNLLGVVYASFNTADEPPVIPAPPH